ncbi:hypothetical protein BC008_12105 [Mastigocoleus testarum BC008]|uniref:Low temperature-induced protein n=2 Tax=Mastigocoleus TaxID=996924 RepID=A0A0V7ZEG9_9CYAN|nr:hypothetical protein BC008_11630 [Mastigocoleus testarum BC008]KST63051.1 hypothetical protein BC008_12105 [Mastigocoleus testarum BC008]
MFATVAGISLATLTLPQVSLANPNKSYDNDRYDPQNNNSQFGNKNDPFNQGVEQNPFSLFQLIHNAQLGNLNPNFASDSGQQINDAAAEFRKKQQQQNQQPQQTGVQQNNNPANSIIIRPTYQD